MARRRAPIATAVPSEHAEQAMVIRWADLHSDPRLKLLYAVPNGARVSIGTARKLKAEGLRAGVPDLVLPVPIGGYHGAYIEMKRVKGGVVSPKQQGWHEALRDQGYYVAVARGAEEAQRLILQYLSGG
jgi:hypothetical protein